MSYVGDKQLNGKCLLVWYLYLLVVMYIVDIFNIC